MGQKKGWTQTLNKGLGGGDTGTDRTRSKEGATSKRGKGEKVKAE